MDVSGDLVADHAAIRPGDIGAAVAPTTTSVVVGDVDEDGILDAFAMIMLAAPFGDEEPVRAYRQVAGGWGRTGVVPSLNGSYGGIYGLIDLDGDGHLDALGSRRSQLVRFGHGDGEFDPPVGVETNPTCVGELSWGQSPWDVDADGWLDLVLAEPCAPSVIVARRTGPRSFALADASWADGGTGGNGQGILSYRRADEQVHLEVATNLNGADDHPGWLVGPAQSADPPSLVRADLTPADVFWRTDPATADNRITEMAAMGAAASDLDDDGVPDVAVSVGRSPLLLLQGVGTGFADRSVDASVTQDMTPFGPIFSWSILPLDLDQDGRKDLLVTEGDDATSFNLARGEPMRPTLWWSAGDWSYQEVGLAAGLDLPGSWHTLSAIDLGDDGDADLVIGGYGSGPRILENRIEVGHHGFSLELVGTTSNVLAVGAQVDIDVRGLPAQHFEVSAQGNLQVVQAPLVFVGLGGETEAELTRVTWPSGWTQEIPGLASGTRHTLIEPWTLQVRDDDRTAPADGATRVEVRIAPRNPDGSVRQSSDLVLRLIGEGSVVTPPAWTGTDYRAELLAPAQPGEARVEVSIDGIPLWIRPRMVWGGE